jgi:hypothetical protein
LQLGDDDFLSHAPEWLLASVTEFGLRHLNGTLMVGGTIIATKSVSTSPDGLIPMSIIIFVIALTFSARYGALPPLRAAHKKTRYAGHRT